MKNIYYVWVGVWMCILWGCASTGGTKAHPEYQVETLITSEPSGARIEINGNYIGDTPVTTRIRHYPEDRVVMGRVVVRATPKEPEGQYIQIKAFNGPQHPFDPNRDVVPERIFFDMRVPTAQ